jgi:hypothetical protein
MSGTGQSVGLLTTSIGIPDGMAGWQVLQNTPATSFTAFMNDPVLQREIAYFKQNAPNATTAQQLLSDPILQNVALTAFGLSSQIGMTGLMEKVLNSNTSVTGSFASQMTDPHFAAIATAFNYGGTSTPATPAVPSSGQVTIDGLGSGGGFDTFSGTFGGVTVSNVGLVGASTPQAVAAALQSAFQRADGNRTDITVKAVGFQLQFNDAQGRGTATSFTWDGPGQATAPTNLVAGSQAQPAQGGPTVTSTAFINQVVSLFTQAEFQQVVGNTSNTLREALYAQQQLPNVTNWYQVIGDPALADVIQTVLGLPSSFGQVNVDQQAQLLGAKMNIADFQNPTKVSALLDKFVAMSQAQAGLSLSSSGTSSSTAGTTSDTFSSASAAVMLLSTAAGNSSNGLGSSTGASPSYGLDLSQTLTG